MSAPELDRRVWSETDRPGERFTLARPLPGVEVVSVRGSHRHWREAHDSFTLALIHRDKKRVVADWHTRARSVSSEAGGIMAIEPGETHVTQRLKLEAGTADFDIVRFAPSLVAAAMLNVGAPANFHFKASAASDSPTFEALRALVRAAAFGDTLDVECAAAQALRVAMSRLAESPPRPLNPVRDYRLRKVKDYLCTHLDRRPTLTELEAVSGLSRYHLCAIFREAYGMSMGHYGNAQRLAEAVRRLGRGTPTKMIVAELGYVDEPYFHRVFKRHYGMAPGAWLATLRANDRFARVRR
jgi:AraC-like DNA-binding protein